MRFEYLTIEYPFSPGTVNTPPNAPDPKDGWEKVWADIDMSGCFAVYRKLKK